MAGLFSDAQNCYTTFYCLIQTLHKVLSKGPSILLTDLSKESTF